MGILIHILLDRNRWSYKVLLILLIQVIHCNTVPKLILISMDGFRYDYLDMILANETENFQYFIKNGVKAKWMKSVFPTVTYPNHYTLLTGLWPESHGIVHNRFLDPKWNGEHFWFDNKMANFDPMWFDVGAEPIYVTNDKAGNGRKTGSVLFPGGLASVKCISPDRIIPNADPFSDMSLIERVDTLISWFTDETDPINLGLLYIPEPDEIAHKYGAASNEVISFIKKELNDVLGHLFKQLKEHELFDSMNIILTSDHGFTNITKFINLDDHIGREWYKTGSDFKNTITVQIYPEDGRMEQIVNALEKVTDIDFYRKGSMYLKDLHFNDNRRIAPLVLTGHEGVAIVNRDTNQTTFAKGMHGYDPNKVENMRPFFLAMGPAFKNGYVSHGFDNVNIYSLMCHILDITPAPNNGSLDNVKQMLQDTIPGKTTAFTLTAVSFILIVGISVTAAGLFAICACHNARKKPRFLLPLSNRLNGAGTRNHFGSNRLLDSDEDDDDEF